MGHVPAASATSNIAWPITIGKEAVPAGFPGMSTHAAQAVPYDALADQGAAAAEEPTFDDLLSLMTS